MSLSSLSWVRGEGEAKKEKRQWSGFTSEQYLYTVLYFCSIIYIYIYMPAKKRSSYKMKIWPRKSNFHKPSILFLSEQPPSLLPPNFNPPPPRPPTTPTTTNYNNKNQHQTSEKQDHQLQENIETRRYDLAYTAPYTDPFPVCFIKKDSVFVCFS